jgi:AbrB family looped-hinge helix DNA binding protein
MRQKELTRVSSKGQIVLPKRYRDEMGIKNGDFVSIYEMADGVLILEKVKPSSLEEITADLRREAKERGFTREELESTIKAIRAERKSDGN